MQHVLSQATGNGIFEVLISAAAQAPALVVLCVVVWVFLKHIKESQQYLAAREAEQAKAQAERERQWEDRQRIRDTHLERLGDTCHEFQVNLAKDSRTFHSALAAQQREAVVEMKEALKENTQVLIGVKNVIAKV